MEYNILQKWIRIYDTEELDGRKVQISGRHTDSGLYTIYGSDEKFDLDAVDWTYVYSPDEMIEMMIEQIYKKTDNKINGYEILYKYKQEPLNIKYQKNEGDGFITIKFSLMEFNYYVQIVEAINEVLEDLFSVDGFMHWDNKFIMGDICELRFIIPDYHVEYKLAED